MKFRIKSYKPFRTSKFGMPLDKCADGVATSDDFRWLAVADGVTKSYIPQGISVPLVEQYVSANYHAGELFERDNAVPLMVKVISLWEEICKNIEDSADERGKYNLNKAKMRHNFGASTFAGLHIGEESISYDILGDSCVFLIPDSEELPPQILTSMPSFVEIDNEKPFSSTAGENGKTFTSHPHFIDTDGRIVGTPKSGKIELFQGTILLMTDALSKWFCMNYMKNDLGGHLKLLKGIETQERFEELIENLRNDDLDNDDVALIIVEIIAEPEVAEEQSVSAEQPAAQIDTEVTEAQPVSAEQPTVQTEPEVAEEQPASDEQPTAPIEPEVAEEQPVSDEQPAVQTEPEVAEEQPASDEQPTAPIEPEVTEAQPVTDEQPAVQTEPEVVVKNSAINKISSTLKNILQIIYSLTKKCGSKVFSYIKEIFSKLINGCRK